MKQKPVNLTRRRFISQGSALSAGAALASSPLGRAMAATPKTRVVLVDTGIRGVKFWGQFVQENYSDEVVFVGLCDINPGRLEFGKSYIGVPECPVFVNFDETLTVAKPDLVTVATVDNTHDEFIVKALKAGINVVTEKPMTTTAEKSGTLLLHKAAHHFDLLNWWIGSDPVEVHAYGALDFYGYNNAFRSERCLVCPYQAECSYFWDITEDQMAMDLYKDNEQYDGYIRDASLWRNEIDIFDKMAVQVKYANGVQVSYSLTTYSPYEGFRLAFNGTEGRLETWEGIPALLETQEDQPGIYQKGMDRSMHSNTEFAFHEIITQSRFGEFQRIQHPFVRKAHWEATPSCWKPFYAVKLPIPACTRKPIIVTAPWRC